jgi:hypothetical protein
VWILSRFDACWRWQRQQTNSLWYPSARLFFQPQPGDWASVLTALPEAIEVWRQQRGDVGG